jgi:hypothetical protein
VENLEKEVRRLVDDNLKLKKQCKEVLIYISMPNDASLNCSFL